MPEESAIKYFTIAEVAKNNGKDTDRVWFIYRDSVYDVTEYLEDHPGGGELITEWAGKDCTKAFDDFGHSGDAKKDLKALKIGEVVEEERKKKSKKNEKEVTKNGKEVTKNGKEVTKNGEKDTNGPKVVDSKEKVINRSCIHIITCGLLV